MNKKIIFGILLLIFGIILFIFFVGYVQEQAPSEEPSLEGELPPPPALSEHGPQDSELPPPPGEEPFENGELPPPPGEEPKDGELPPPPGEEFPEDELEEGEHFINQNENWRTETVDDSGWVGIDSSIAVDSEGNPHISHYNQGNRDLKYAKFADAAWKNETVDSKGDVGEESGIAIDNKGIPHISYIDVTNGGVKYAKREGNSWSIETVDKLANYRTVSTSIALDSESTPHIIYTFESAGNAGNGDVIKYAFWSGDSWKTENVSSNGLDVYLALDSNDKPHVSFVKENPNTNKKRIYYANKTSGSWSVESVDSPTRAGGDTGIAVDSENHAHIAYHDYGNGSIKYAYWNGDSWDIKTVEQNVGSEEGLKIAVDALNNPHIIYTDAEKELLIYATLNGDSWVKETVNRMGNPSIAIDHLNRVHVAHGYTVEGENAEEEPSEEQQEILKYSIRE